MNSQSQDCSSNPNKWQADFLDMRPEIQQRLYHAFRRRDPATRDEVVADGTLLCLLSYTRLHQQGRTASITASSLARFAAKQLRSGRSAGCRLNSSEPLALYAQRRRGIRVEPLHENKPNDEKWIDAITQDRRSTVLDQVAAKLDVAAWLLTLCRRTRQIAADIAKGGTTAEVARKYDVTSGRISQLRRELATSWSEFQHEPALAT